MPFKPCDIEYLIHGNERQKKAYAAIQAIDLFQTLSKYSPILAGTIPLDIDTELSDLDIICYSSDLDKFIEFVANHYSKLPAFESFKFNIRGEASAVVRFEAEGFAFELFCQSIPVLQQNAVLHLQVEARLLNLAGVEAKNAIRDLKKLGIKTEPAFAKYFKIQGDPYYELAKMAHLSDKELLKFLSA